MREHRDASRDALDREVGAPFGVSLTGNGRSETAKFLPVCKAVSLCDSYEHTNLSRKRWSATIIPGI